jgi:RNA polymerase sigma factor (sigma-70 family)
MSSLARFVANDRDDSDRSGDKWYTNAMILDRLNQRAATASWTTEPATMTDDAVVDDDKARRFRDAALPHLDDVFGLARYLMRNAADAEDAVQECYLRALHHFDSYRGPAIKPWLLTILRNICNSEFARRGQQAVPTDFAGEEPAAEAEPIWQEPPASPETVLLREQDSAAIRRLVAALPQPFREVVVLREINDLSYQEIAQVAGVPVGTVMSRLARARSMLRASWTLQKG